MLMHKVQLTQHIENNTIYRQSCTKIFLKFMSKHNTTKRCLKIWRHPVKHTSVFDGFHDSLCAPFNPLMFTVKNTPRRVWP